MSTLQIDPVISSLSNLSVQLLTPDYSVTVPPLVDSGSSGNFISQDLLSPLHLPRKRHSQKFQVETIQGKPLGRGWVKFRALPLKLRIGNFHEEDITFLVLERPTADIILGCPWLVLHSPEIRWDLCEVTCRSKHCHCNFLMSLPTPHPRPSSVQVASTLIESPEPQEQVAVPSDYRALQDVFSNQAVTQLPPHEPWDCAIDLLGSWNETPQGQSCPSRSARPWRNT